MAYDLDGDAITPPPIRWSIQEHQDGRSIVLAPGERLELVNDSARERRVIVPEAGVEPDAEAEVDKLKAEVERLRAEHRKAKRAAGRAIAERRLAEARVPGGILADQAERLDGLKSKLVDKLRAEVDRLTKERDAIESEYRRFLLEALRSLGFAMDESLPTTGAEMIAEIRRKGAEVERLRAENATLRAGPTIRAPGREELYRREAERLRRERDDLLLAVRAACQQALDSPDDTDALLSAIEGVFEAVKGIAGPDATTEETNPDG